MASAATPVSRSGGWARAVERFVLVTLLVLGGTTIVAASWARDVAIPRVALLGADRGLSALVTAGSARILILNGTDAAELGNAVGKTRHPGLDRIDITIVSGNAAASAVAVRAIELLEPRMVVSVSNSTSLEGTTILPGKIIDHTTEIELPDGVLLTVEVWPAANGENDDVTWSVMIQRGGASIYWVSDREALMQHDLPARADVIVIGRGGPAADTPLPNTHAIVVAAESITGPELRAFTLDSLGPEIQTARVFAGDMLRIDLDPTGIRSITGGIPAGTPVGG